MTLANNWQNWYLAIILKIYNFCYCKKLIICNQIPIKIVFYLSMVETKLFYLEQSHAFNSNVGCSQWSKLYWKFVLLSSFESLCFVLKVHRWYFLCCVITLWLLLWVDMSWTQFINVRYKSFKIVSEWWAIKMLCWVSLLLHSVIKIGC